MKRKIIQIYIGDISEERVSDMQTVREYADKHGYEYNLITKVPSWLRSNNLSPRNASDWMRVKILSESPYTLYVDIDVEIIGNIELGEDPILTPYFEHFIYNGNNLQLFKNVMKNMIDRRSKTGESWKTEEGIIYKSFRTVEYKEDWKVDSTGLYIHKWASKGEKR